MKAAYYEKNGSARDVLQVDEIATPEPGPGEVRVKLAASGVNPSDVKSRQGSTRKIMWPRLVPQSDPGNTDRHLLVESPRRDRALVVPWGGFLVPA